MAGVIAKGIGRGTLVGLLAGIFAILAIAVLAVFNFVLVGDATTGVLKDLLGGLTGQPVYILQQSQRHPLEQQYQRRWAAL